MLDSLPHLFFTDTVPGIIHRFSGGGCCGKCISVLLRTDYRSTATTLPLLLYARLALSLSHRVPLEYLLLL